MDDLVRDLILLAARRDARARAALRAVVKVRKTARRVQKISGEIKKLGGTK